MKPVTMGPRTPAIAALLFVVLAGRTTAQPPRASTAPPAPPLRIEGVVKDAAGQPVQKALVMARALDAERHERTVLAHTDASGRFSAAVPRRGAYQVRVEAARLAAETLPRVLVPADVLEIRLGPGVAIEGVVRDSRGQPVPNAAVEARTGVRPGTSLLEPDAGGVRTTSGAGGVFRLQGLNRGSYLLTAGAAGVGGAAQAVVAPARQVGLVLLPGPEVQGSVRGSDGRPVAGAAVYLSAEAGFLSAGGRPAVRRTDESGAFQIWGAAPGAYSVVAHRDGAGSAARRVVLDHDSRERVDLSLAAPVRMRGRLVDDGQRPVEGAIVLQEVEGLQVAATLGQIIAAESDAGGRFVLEGVPRGAVALAVTAPAFKPRRMELQASAPELDLGDAALERGLAVAGRVTDEAGRPIAGAEVRAYSGSSSPDRRWLEGQTEADGTFLLAGADPGMYQVTARADGFTSALTRVSAGTEPVVIVLARGGSVVGAVLDETGAAVPEFDVAAEPEDQPEGAQGGHARGEGGRFELQGLAPGRWLLKVKAPDTATAVKAVTVRAAAATDAGTIRLSAGATLRGRVTDAAGSPVPGASVWWDSPAGTRGYRDTAMSDAAGLFVLRGIDLERVDLVADHPEYAPARTAVDVDPRLRAGEVRIVLTAGGRVEGTVRRRDGAPMAGAYVRIGSITGPGFRQRGAPVMPDGTYAVDHVPAGLMRVMLLSNLGGAAVGTVQQREVKVGEGETAVVDFLLRDILVSGTVTRRGEPAAAFIVQARGRRGYAMHVRGDGTVADQDGRPRRGFAITRQDGGYEMLLDEPGPYTVAVSTGDGRQTYPPRTIEVPDADSFRVDFAIGGASVSGQVVDAETGKPLVAEVMARPLESGAGATGRALAGAEGRFVLEVAPGDWLLSTQLDGYAPGAIRLRVPESGTSDVRLALTRGLKISGRVVDAGGRGVAGAEISAMPERAGGQGQPPAVPSFGFVRSGADGRFAIEGLSDVRHDVSAGHDAAGYASLQGIAAGTADLLLRMMPGGRVRVVVLAPDGSPASGAFVSVRSVDGHHVISRPARTDAAGVAELTAPAGKAELHAGHATARGSVTVVVGPGETALVEIRLEPVTPGPGTR